MVAAVRSSAGLPATHHYAGMNKGGAEIRSKIMAAVRQRNTEPEMVLRRALHSCGLRFRLPQRGSLPGSPDIVFRSAMVAVFVDGCFWHGCPTHGTSPKTNASFWEAKIKRNRQRDEYVDERLKAMGWQPVRLWEHEVLPDPTDAACKVWAIVRSREPG